MLHLDSVGVFKADVRRYIFIEYRYLHIFTRVASYSPPGEESV